MNIEKNTMFADFPDLLTTKDLQEALHISKNTAYKLISEGQIKHMTIGRSIKIPKQYLIDFVIESCYNNDAVTGNSSCHTIKEGVS